MCWTSALLAEAEPHQRVPQHHLGGELGQGHPDRLRHERHRPGGARIDLEDEDLLVLDRELDVEQADDAQLGGERAGLRLDALDLVVAQRVGRQRARGVAGVHARLLHVLHDPAHHHPLAVRDGVHVDLEGVLEELVHQDGMLRAHPHRFLHVVLEIRLVVHDLHGAPAQHVGRPHQHRVADGVRDPRGLLEGARGGAGRLREPEPVEEIREAAAVLGAVDGVGRRAQDRHARALERHHQLERGLAAELHDDPARLLALHDVHHVLERERLEVEAVGGVVVGGDRLRVAVDHDRLDARVPQREGGVHARVVELDALADAVGPAAEDHHLLARGREGLVLFLVGRVEVRACGPRTRPRRCRPSYRRV